MNYTVKEISSMLNVCEEQVRRWIREGELNACKESKKNGYRITNEDLKNFMDSKPKYRLDGYEVTKSTFDMHTRTEYLTLFEYHLSELLKISEILKEL